VQPSTPPLSSGSIVAARFRLEKLLGEGGMGAVWSARHVVTKRAVAIKFLKPPASLDLVQRFMREAQAANAVRHPNVVVVHDFFELESGLPAMVMDLFDGDTLASQLERRSIVPLRELARIMLSVVSALSAIHAAGIVHRDLKPENVFLAQLPDGRVEPMVLDFGICKLDASEAALGQSDISTTAGRIIGSPCYMAPEQVRGAADIDARTDIWSLGVMLYECVTGVRPFDGDSMALVVARITAGPLRPVEELAPQLPPQLASVINRMLRRDRGERLSDLSQLAAALSPLAKSPSFSALETPAPVAQRSPEPLVTGVHPTGSRAAETIARARVTTMSSSVFSIGAETGRRSRKASYFGLVFAGAALLGGLVAVVGGQAQSRAASAAQPAPSQRALPSPAAVDASLTTPGAAPRPSSEPEPAAVPVEALTVERVQPPRPRRPMKPVTDFGGRR
jgi:eukaryotic-like serine/threonine-protein kinase